MSLQIVAGPAGGLAFECSNIEEGYLASLCEGPGEFFDHRAEYEEEQLADWERGQWRDLNCQEGLVDVFPYPIELHGRMDTLALAEADQ